jgi:hypothetical protein
MTQVARAKLDKNAETAKCFKEKRVFPRDVFCIQRKYITLHAEWTFCPELGGRNVQETSTRKDYDEKV